ncbi:lytic transglycosylase domain-containing protein [Shewanella colwelliana]|uniref:lytic transglycosylase domain-containing protein n=1 Tax=Shewanella colwelliana TaxID=23 RepID=UPI0022AF6DBD|nr:lytic transglycosylase domain-containing protein [Shewanella colwelliana]MCZ4337764.1 lytic transglycosylase domain-containing protein [Shewanella colwelliana]
MKKYKPFKNCIYWQSEKYGVNELLVMAVILQEGGKPSSKNRNSDGTYDYGILQINDVRSNELIELGYELSEVRSDGCKGIEAGIHLLSREIKRAKKDAGNHGVWLGVGRYHYSENGEYPHNHYKYRQGVSEKLERLIRKIKSGRDNTYQVVKK